MDKNTKKWDAGEALAQILEDIKKEAGDKNATLRLSSNVDSVVMFALLNEALGKNRVKGILIDNGLMRMHEVENIAKSYRNIGFDNLIVEDFSEGFLKSLAGITDAIVKWRKINYYSEATVKNIVTEKYHLNDWLTFTPLPLWRLSDHDEVRQIGERLGLPCKMLYHPIFPSAGLAANILCTDGSVPDDYWQAQDSFTETLFGSVEILEMMDQYDVAVDLLEVKVIGKHKDFAYPLALTYWPKPPLRKKFWRIPDNWDEVEHLSQAFTDNFKEVNRVVVSLYSRHVNRFRCHRPVTYCTKENLDQVRQVDDIVLGHLKETGWYDQIYDQLTIRLPREYYAGSGHCAIVLHTMCSEDEETAHFAKLPQELLTKIVKDIANKCEFVDEIFYDVTNDLPANYCWE